MGDHFTLVNLKVRAGRGEKQAHGQSTKSFKVFEAKEAVGVGGGSPAPHLVLWLALLSVQLDSLAMDAGPSKLKSGTIITN